MYNRNNVVLQASAWLGCKESNGTHKQIIDIYNNHKPRARGYKVKYTDAWCATFVSAVAIKLGYTDIIPTECSCPKMIALLKKKGSFVEADDYIPKAGDILFYDWDDNGNGDNKGTPDHVGIVERVNGNQVVVIEGNYMNGVNRRVVKLNGRNIRGWGAPKYDENASEASEPFKSVSEVAKEVMRGMWGNGTNRFERLRKAGYDPQEVQRKVNELLRG